MEAWTPAHNSTERLRAMVAGAARGDAVTRGMAPALAPGLARTARRLANSPGDPDVFLAGGADAAARVLRAAFAGAASPGEPWLRYRMAAASAATTGARAGLDESLDIAFACQFAARLGAIAASMAPGVRPTLDALAPMQAIVEAGGEPSDPRAGVPLLHDFPGFLDATARWWSACMHLQEAVCLNFSPQKLAALLSNEFGRRGTVHGGIHVAAYTWLRCGSHVADAADEAAAACPIAAPLAAALAGASGISSRVGMASALRGTSPSRHERSAFAALATYIRWITAR